DLADGLKEAGKGSGKLSAGLKRLDKASFASFDGPFPHRPLPVNSGTAGESGNRKRREGELMESGRGIVTWAIGYIL
ncbi:hypothetical protein, partial [Streptomyces sp. NPDC056785]|uniref:hypothetical protein n=1 Tax=Streptomyces sp. NPDC056785 TaxID=3345944 RepID=UPI00368872A0